MIRHMQNWYLYLFSKLLQISTGNEFADFTTLLVYKLFTKQQNICQQKIGPEPMLVKDKSTGTCKLTKTKSNQVPQNSHGILTTQKIYSNLGKRVFIQKITGFYSVLIIFFTNQYTVHIRDYIVLRIFSPKENGCNHLTVNIIFSQFVWH